jgi:hypothetical protein
MEKYAEAFFALGGLTGLGGLRRGERAGCPNWGKLHQQLGAKSAEKMLFVSIERADAVRPTC